MNWKGKIKSDNRLLFLVVTSAISIPIMLALCFAFHNWYPCPLVLFLLISYHLQEYGNRNAKREELSGERLSPLAKMGFSIENQGKYWGYTGTYRGYYMKVNYEPSCGRNGVEQMFFTLYFQYTGESNFASKMAELKRKYIDSRSIKILVLFNYLYEIRTNDISRIQNTTLFQFTSAKDILDTMVEIAQTEDLAPIEGDKIEESIKSDPLGFAPPNYIYEYQEKSDS